MPSRLLMFLSRNNPSEECDSNEHDKQEHDDSVMNNNNNNNNRKDKKPSKINNNDDDNVDVGFSVPSILNDVSFSLVDGLAIWVGCLLLGLSDVLNDSSFWLQGGWLQPIVSSSSPVALPSLPTLLQRTVLYSCLYIIASAGAIRLQQSSSSTTTTTAAGIQRRNANNDDTSTIMGLTSVLVPCVIMTVLRLLVGFIIVLVDRTTETGSGLMELLVLPTIRECYFVALALLAGQYIRQRFLYGGGWW